MNLTQIIEETGKRIRLGKRHADKLTNVEIKEVLDIALAVLQEGLVQEGRVEIQDFAVLEVVTTRVKTGGQLTPFGGTTPVRVASMRRRWLFHPAQALRQALRQAASGKTTRELHPPVPSSST